MKYFLFLCLGLTACGTFQERCEQEGFVAGTERFTQCVTTLERNWNQGAQGLMQGSQYFNNQNSGGSTDFNCMNRCTASGSMYGFCKSRCSY
jgi:hypothetical protein